MARTRKSIQPLNLYKYNVLIDDKGPRSEYFKISQFDGYFYGGRNAFLIAGATVLQPNSKVLVEILNKDGTTVYSAPVPSFIEGSSRLIQVEVYEDTPIGPGKIVVLGCANVYIDGTPIPEEWKDKYNVRWVTDVIISPLVQNKTPIRFAQTPAIQVKEKFYTAASASFYSESISFPVDITFSPKKYTVFQNGYTLQNSGPSEDTRFFSKHENGVITGSFSFIGSSGPETASVQIPITKIFNKGTALSEGQLIFTDKYTLFSEGFISSSGQYTTLLQPFGIVGVTSSLSLQYNEVVTGTKGPTISFAKLRLSDLRTISGEINKLRISYKSTTEPGEYILLGDAPINRFELLTIDSASRIAETGKFNTIDINKYWYSATMSLAKNETAPVLPEYYYDSTIVSESQSTFLQQCCTDILNAISATPEIVNNTFVDNKSYFIGTRDINGMELYPRSEYTLLFDAFAARSTGSIELIQDNYSLEIYLVENSGSSGKLLKQDPRGQLIGTIAPTDTFLRQNFGKIALNFIPRIDQVGSFGLRFVVYGGHWSIANVSVKTAQEPFYSSDEHDLLIPNINYTDSLLTFKIEYLDINNNSVGITTISDPCYFTGSAFGRSTDRSSGVVSPFPFTGDAVITGSLLITGSGLYVSGSTQLYGDLIVSGNVIANIGSLKTVFYVTEEGSDLNNGKTLDTAFKTIRQACIAASASIAAFKTEFPMMPAQRVTIKVKTGYYIETASIWVPPNTSIYGDDLRTTVVRPTYDTRSENLFLMSNGTYAYGLRLEGCEIDNLEDPRKGFFFALAPSASITTSPYIQNCTAAHAPPDKFYTPLNFADGNSLVGNGPGGMIVDDSVLDGYSPLKSMIVDAYTQVAFNGIGLCVRGRGYAQQVSFFTNFSRVGIYALDGGHASLLNSNTTFGDYGLRSKGRRTLVVPDITTISNFTSSADSAYLLAEKTNIQNYMMTNLIAYGNYSASYATNTAVSASTIKDSGLLIDSIAADLLVESASRTSNFIQGLFKGQDTSPGSIYTLPPAPGFSKGAIAVFRVNDGYQMAGDFTASYKYIREYIVNNIPSISSDGKLKLSQSLDVAIKTIESVVMLNESSSLQDFGSLVTSTSHDFSYAGSGVNFLSLPPNQLGAGIPNADIRIFEEDGGRVFYTAGDETGDYYAGTDFVIRQETGTIEGRTFNKALAAQFTPLTLALEST